MRILWVAHSTQLIFPKFPGGMDSAIKSVDLGNPLEGLLSLAYHLWKGKLWYELNVLLIVKEQLTSRQL